MPFWRREPLHRRLARKAGLEGPLPHQPGPHWGEVGIHGIARPRQWDATVVAEVPELAVDELEFVALPDGTLLLDVEGDAEPLADALESSLEPPYRARAVRRGPVFAIAASRIRVEELPPEVDGDRIQLTVGPEGRTLTVDARPAFGSLPALERLAGDLVEFVIDAERLDGTLWEVGVTPL
jgi:hypothetical protein